METLALPLLVLVAGLVLLIAEAFVPSGGLIGVLSLGLLGVSLYLGFRISFNTGLGFVVAELILIPIAVVVMLQIWPHTPLARKIFLAPPTVEEVEVTHGRPRLDHLIGEFGRALTPLRPSGLVDFDGRRLEAMSEEGMIDAGALVRAVRHQGARLIVRSAGDEVAAPPSPLDFGAEPESPSPFSSI